jgi:DeoR/GlpR family transcriptional regulator of sugar metabolism
MMKCADEVVIVADHTKIGKQALAHLCPLSAVNTLIVDGNLTVDQRHLIERAGVSLLVVEVES